MNNSPGSPVRCSRSVFEDFYKKKPSALLSIINVQAQEAGTLRKFSAHFSTRWTDITPNVQTHLQLASFETQGADICFLMPDNCARSSAIIGSRC